MMEQTSLESFDEIKEHLNRRQMEVYYQLKQLGSATNTMIASALRRPINTVVPRVFELREKGVVGMDITETCPITKRKAIFWIVKGRLELPKIKNGK